MAIDQRTPNFALPPPHPLNRLEDDVSRIRGALEQLDGLILLLNQAVASNDGALDTLQELVTAHKAAAFDLLRMVPAASSVITYDGAGLVTQVADVLPGGLPRTTTYTYSGGRVATETLVCDSVTHRTTYTYTGDRVTSVARAILS